MKTVCAIPGNTLKRQDMPFSFLLPADWNETLMAQPGAATSELGTEATVNRTEQKGAWS